MRILIVGGTGFIGYHTVKECLGCNYKVTVLALPPLPADDFLPPEVDIILSDINKLPDTKILKLFNGHDVIVDAAGADDRVIPKIPAYDFFYVANVKFSVRLFKLAREAGIKRGILLSSYFSYFDRIWPEKKLAHHHPYIRSRKEQAEQTLNAAMPELELIILELPYIFGSTPGRIPIWAPLIDYIRTPLPLFYSRGGTNMIAVKNVAEAIVGAIKYGKGGEKYQVGDENITWIDFLRRLSDLTGRRKKVITLPDFVVLIIMKMIQFYHHVLGKEAGLNPVEFTKLQTINTFFDSSHSRKILGYGHGELDKALQDTVFACLANRSGYSLNR
jgi:nucleoside-diphosphate-sugar epimerase